MFDYSRKPVKWQVGNFSKLDTFSAYSYKEGEDVELDITFFENIKDPYSDDIPFAIVTDIRKKEKCNR